jgi:hypothetical protein
MTTQSIRSPRAGDKPRNAAEKKLIAAQQAHSLLLQFDRNISATEGSVFCRLAALLHGTPKAKFHSPCSKVMRRHTVQ